MSSRAFTLYWSSLEMYEKCPQKFLWSRGWGDIDVGGGPGRKKPKPERRPEHHIVMGNVIGGVVEDLYNDELWKSPQDLKERLLERVERRFEVETKKPKVYLPWGAPGMPTEFEMLQTCKDGVVGFLRTMKANKLLGPYSKAEVELLGYINKYNPVGGRCDILIRREDTGVTILDGKNGQTKGKYTDPDQLRWYALCFYLSYNSLPDRLGFVYFRYPFNEENGETGVDWVAFSKDDIKGIAHRAVEARRGMEKQNFPATPSPTVCKLCDYETVCPARQAQKEANRRGPRKPKEVEILLGNADGVMELSFGDSSGSDDSNAG